TCTGASCLPTMPTGEYAVELVPPAGSALVAEQLPSFQADADGHARLRFVAPAKLSGRVYRSGASDYSVAAHISAVPVSTLIPGHSQQFSTDTVAGLFASGTPGYALLVPPGLYELTITTNLDGVPPVVQPGIAVDANNVLDLVLPADSDLVTVEGRVYDAT